MLLYKFHQSIQNFNSIRSSSPKKNSKQHHKSHRDNHGYHEDICNYGNVSNHTTTKDALHYKSMKKNNEQKIREKFEKIENEMFQL